MASLLKMLSYRRLAGLMVSISLIAPAQAEASIINARSVSLKDVTSALASAADGDTVIIPAGIATWTGGLTITKAITLQGSGIGNTIIKDAIRDNTKRLVHFTLVPGKASRLTGIEFQDGGSGGHNNGFMSILGSNIDGRSMRIDHCKFVNLKQHIEFNTVRGVADHNTILTNQNGFFTFNESYYNGAKTPYGDASRSAPIHWGSSDFFFVEDNDYTGTSPNASNFVTDGYAGARFVIRHNNIIDGAIAAHGTDSSGRKRSSAAHEIYNNRFTQTTPRKGTSWGHVRGGVTILHDNTLSGFGPQPSYPLTCFRMVWPFWYGADGTNPWDINRHGGPFFSGTAAEATGPPVKGLTTLTVSGNPNWTTDQWAGYTIKRTTNLGRSTSKAYFSEIKSNTANSLTYLPGFTSNLTLAPGDSFELWKVEQALDQAGVSGGQLLTIGIVAQPPSRPTPPRPGWNDQVITPCYSWNNTREGGVHVNFGRTSRLYKEGVHYFNDTPMPGYTPYTYPHPLTTGLPPPEQMTRNAPENSQDDLGKKRQPWGGKKLDRKKAKKAKESPTNEMPDGQDNPGN
jgi:hypothetical protein